MNRSLKALVSNVSRPLSPPQFTIHLRLRDTASLWSSDVINAFSPRPSNSLLAFYILNLSQKAPSLPL